MLWSVSDVCLATASKKVGEGVKEARLLIRLIEGRRA